MIWLSALAVGAVLLVAIKLQSIIITLAQDAYQLYGCQSGGWVGGCAGWLGEFLKHWLWRGSGMRLRVM